MKQIQCYMYIWIFVPDIHCCIHSIQDRYSFLLTFRLFLGQFTCTYLWSVSCKDFFNLYLSADISKQTNLYSYSKFVFNLQSHCAYLYLIYNHCLWYICSLYYFAYFWENVHKSTLEYIFLQQVWKHLCRHRGR